MAGLARCVLVLLSAASVLPARACVVRGGVNGEACSELSFQLPRTLAWRRWAGFMGAGGGFGVVRDAKGSENLKASGTLS